LKLISDNPLITARQLAELLDVSPRNIEKQMAILKNGRQLQRSGGRKNGVWIVMK
jgi:predicted HTH transcriptional regulator